MGLFYNPPQPPTASNSGTPPEPHVPIGTQGNQPPRYTTALMLVAVMASWPLDLEPRLSKPNERQQNIAPLTLTYGQQPAQIGTARQTAQTIIGNWPLDLEPRLSAPNNRQQAIAPLTLRYGDPPAIIGASAINESLIVRAWPLDLEPRLGLPNAVRVGVAPLALTYGSQPTPTPALNVAEWTAITAPVPEWSAQGPPRSLAWFVPPVVSSYQAPPPFPYALVLASWPADLEPRLSSPNDKRQKIAPLTLTYGDQPPPQPALVGTDLLTILAAWPTGWDAQTAPKNAAWNVPPLLVQVPYARLPRGLWTAWEPVWLAPPPLVTVATLTLPTGDAPPPIAVPPRTIWRLWEPPWQSPPPLLSVVAALYVPPIIPPGGRGPAVIMIEGRLALRVSDFLYVWLT